MQIQFLQLELLVIQNLPHQDWSQAVLDVARHSYPGCQLLRWAIVAADSSPSTAQSADGSKDILQVEAVITL